MAKREQEIKQLQGWKTTVQTLIERFEDLVEEAASLMRAQGEPRGLSHHAYDSLSGIPSCCGPHCREVIDWL